MASAAKPLKSVFKGARGPAERNPETDWEDGVEGSVVTRVRAVISRVKVDAENRIADERDQSSERIADLDSALQICTAALRHSRADNTELRKLNQKCHTKIGVLEATMAGLQKKFRNALDERTQMQGAVEDAHNDIVRLEMETKRMSELLESINNVKAETQMEPRPGSRGSTGLNSRGSARGEQNSRGSQASQSSQASRGSRRSSLSREAAGGRGTGTPPRTPESGRRGTPPDSARSNGSERQRRGSTRKSNSRESAGSKSAGGGMAVAGEFDAIADMPGEEDALENMDTHNMDTTLTLGRERPGSPKKGASKGASKGVAKGTPSVKIMPLSLSPRVKGGERREDGEGEGEGGGNGGGKLGAGAGAGLVSGGQGDAGVEASLAVLERVESRLEKIEKKLGKGGGCCTIS